MKVLLITDIHGEVEKLEKILSREAYDAVLCAGDLSDANKFQDYSSNLEEVLETLDRTGKMNKAVPGNMDPEETCVKKLIDYRMNIHKKVASFEEFEVVGFGGGKTPFDTPFEPEGAEIREVVEMLYSRMKQDTRVAVIHQPPEGTLDVVEGEHVGSPEVRELLEEKDFDLVLTGHIHEARGTDSVDGTALVNPGPVAEGFYATAEIEEGGVELDMKSI